MSAEVTQEIEDAHTIDTSRTVVHDLDRAGDFYDAWCRCGVQVANWLPHWTEHGEPGGSVEAALKEYRERVALPPPSEGTPR